MRQIQHVVKLVGDGIQPPDTPVANVGQIMRGIVDLAASVVFNSVSVTVTIEGTEEKAPQTGKECEAVGDAAAALIESGNLLLMGSRALDKGDWLAYSEALMEAGEAALRATQAKSADRLLETGGAIYEACDNWHRKYRRGQ